MPARGALVGFAAESYVILPGETVALEVCIESEAGEPDDLFSYGVRLVPSTTDSIAPISIDVPTALDFSGVSGPGANIDLSTDVLGVKGNIDVFADPLGPYGDDLLATFRVQIGSAGDYGMSLDLFRTLGANEQIFLGGDGTVLDDDITFGGATVRVIEEGDLLPDVIIEESGGGADMDVRFPTIIGLTYLAQTSTNLVDWFDLGDAAEGDGSEFIITHIGGASGPRNFYRVTVTTDGE